MLEMQLPDKGRIPAQLRADAFVETPDSGRYIYMRSLRSFFGLRYTNGPSKTITITAEDLRERPRIAEDETEIDE